MEVIDRLFDPPKGHYFLFGPRGTGKSTFAGRHYPGAVSVDLLDPEAARSLSARPERLREILAARKPVGFVVIDEVQRVPDLLPVVHALIEEKAGWKFILTGSSTRKIRRAGVNLLGGRAMLATMHPFMAAELGDAFRLDQALKEGLLPVVVSSDEPARTLGAYAALYLREEVQAEGLVRNVGNFARFLEAVSFSHGAVLNVANVARECEVERKVVEGFLGILEDLLLAFRFPVFTRRARREMSSHPKFFLFDAGVFRSLRPAGPLDRPEEIEGQALEGIVAQHLRAWAAYSAVRRDLFFWRTRAGSEVDFVVYGPEGLFGIEVKNVRSIRPSDLRGLRSFRDEYPQGKAVLLYRGKERFLRDNVLCVPCGEFLGSLHTRLSIDSLFPPGS